MAVVMEEADESQFWLQHFDACGFGDRDGRSALLAEATELVAIFTASLKSASAGEEEGRRQPQRSRRKRRRRTGEDLR